ncbi:MAG: DHH family phosphoesterase [Clostridia bacterium]|nr:DHH family phosphoesterase [Clostridia bacterium]
MSKHISKKERKNNNLIFKIIANSIVYLILILITVFANTTSNSSLFTAVILSISIFYTVFIILYDLRSKNLRLQEYEIGFDRSFGKSMKRLELPVLFISKQGKLIWENAKSVELKLKEYLQEISYEVLKTSKKELPSIAIENSKFNIYSTEVVLENDVGSLVILVDKTKEKYLAKELDDTKAVVGCIVIDSFEEIMQGLEDLDKFNTTSKIDKEIVEWIAKYNGVVSKIEKDRYVYVIDKKYVKDLEDNSFEILEKMNMISEDVLKIPVTISIGLSFDEDNLYARYKSALTALDIAMGRGGNQAVIKNSKKYDIYDGSSLQMDKTNKVRARTIAQALKDIILKSENIYIMGHKNTDIDSIGASVGIYKIAKTLGKQAKIISDTKHNSTTKNVIDRLKIEKEYEGVFLGKEDCKKLDFDNSLLIIVDTHKESYLAVPDLLEQCDKCVIIDHHRRGPEFIQDAILTYHEVYASSTAELVTELLMYLDEVKLTPKEAETIFSGIVIDTKNFTFKTGVRTFEVAAYLKKMGLDMAEIKHLFQNDFETYMARVNIVRNAEIIDGQIAISCAQENIKDISVISAQAADELLSITGILASFVLCEIDGVVMVSGRSLGDINVQLILEKMGGGGHLTFAGAQMAGVTIEEARQRLLEEIKEYFKKLDN